MHYHNNNHNYTTTTTTTTTNYYLLTVPHPLWHARRELQHYMHMCM